MTYDDEENRIPAIQRPSVDTLVARSSPDNDKTNRAGELEKGGPLTLTAEEALARARAHPDDDTKVNIIFSPNDKDNPRNWPTWKRYYVAAFACWLNVLTCLLAGSISSAAEELQERFQVSAEVTTLSLSLYVLGLGFGPLLLAPLSEYFGRRPVYIVSWFLAFMFQIPVALAQNIGTILVCRFLAGCFGSAPLTNSGGTISDLFKRDENGWMMAIYGISSTSSPALALVFSGFLAMNEGFRILFWTLFAITGGFWVILVLTMPETRHSIILQRKTRQLKKLMKKEGLKAASDIQDANASDRKGITTLFKVTLTRPFHFLLTEPITIFAAAYNGFLYGLVYLFNEAFPLVFGKQGHNFNTGEVGLSFLGLTIGPIIAFCFYPLQERYYHKRVRENDGKGVPEARVWMARGGAIIIPISLFWFAWTSYPSVHWIVPIIASAFFGAGLYIIILSILNYVVDAYQTYSASALAGVILVRNLVGGGFPLFATQMYKYMGNEWASSLLGFLAILLVPIPFILFYKGEAIRLKSPWAREHFDQDEDVPH